MDNARNASSTKLRKTPSSATMSVSSSVTSGAGTTSGSSSSKLPVAKPASLSHFVVVLVMHICRRILLIDTVKRLAVYLILIVSISLVTDFFPAPKSYFSNKSNVLNQYFVKLGWGWTCAPLLLYVYLTSSIFCVGDQRLINRHLARLGIAATGWLVCTRGFDCVRDRVGFCAANDQENTSREECIAGRHLWISFDISGHAFLLVHCLLTISEEARCALSWERLGELVQSSDAPVTSGLDNERLEFAREAYRRNTPYIRLTLVVLTLLMLLWEVMLASTIVYFHNMPQKLVGATCAAVWWFVSYRLCFGMADVWWCPRLVGHGFFPYQKAATSGVLKK